MRDLKILLTLTGLALLGAAGCSPLHTEIDLSYPWTKVSTVTLEAPAQDSWGLAPVVRKELQGLGYVLAPPEAGNPDLVVRFATQDGPDFTPDGLLVTRPKSLHVQFVDPHSATLLAVADYFLRSAEDPADVMRTALAGLHERIHTAGSGTLPVAASPVQAPAAVVEKKTLSETPPADLPAALPATAGADSLAVTSPDAAPDTTPSPTPAPATSTAAAGEKPVIKPVEQSPWVPRFKSWGFADWGKTDDSER